STSYSSIHFFFFTDSPTTEIYTLSLHDALPISEDIAGGGRVAGEAILRAGIIPGLRPGPARGLDNDVLAQAVGQQTGVGVVRRQDRKSTRLNSSHDQISYAVFCLKKKKKKKDIK